MANWWDAAPVVDSGPKERPDWGAGARELPDGSIVRYGPRGGMTVLQGPTKPSDAPPDIKEFQSKAAAQATLMDQALSDYDAARKDGYDPASWKNAAALGLEGVWGVGPFLADVVRDNPSERGRAAELAYTEGSLRALTGAAATEGETRRNARNMFRQPGESQAVEPNKAAVRERFAATTKRIAGPAYIPVEKPAPADRSQGKAKPPGWTKGLPQKQLAAAKLFAGATTRAGDRTNPYVPENMDEFNKIPRGAWLIDDDGTIFQKGAR